MMIDLKRSEWRKGRPARDYANKAAAGLICVAVGFAITIGFMGALL